MNSCSGFILLTLQMGLDCALTRHFCSTKEKRQQAEYFSTVFWMRFLVFFIFLLFVFCYSKDISMLIFKTPHSFILIRLLFLSTFAQSIFNLLLELFRFNDNAFSFGCYSVGCLSVRLLLVLLFLIPMKLNISGIFLANILVYFSVIFFLCIKQRYYLFHFKKNIIFPLLKFGLPLIPSAITYGALIYVDRFFIQHFCGIQQTGYYGLAIKLASMLSLITLGFQKIWAPYVYSNFENKEFSEIHRTMFFICFFILSSISFTLSFFSKDIILLIANPNFIEASIAISLLTFGQTLFFCGTYFSNGIIISKKTHIHSYISALVMVINILLNYLFVPKYGITGAAAATFISNAIYGNIAIYISKKIMSNLNPKFNYCLIISTILVFFLVIQESIKDYRISIYLISFLVFSIICFILFREEKSLAFAYFKLDLFNNIKLKRK